MAVFEVNVWIVSKGKDEEHEKLMERIIQYERANPDKFKEQESLILQRLVWRTKSSWWSCLLLGI
jgi:hypothetical protein